MVLTSLHACMDAEAVAAGVLQWCAPVFGLTHVNWQSRSVVVLHSFMQHYITLSDKRITFSVLKQCLA